MIHKYDLAFEQCEVKIGRNGRFTGYASVFDGLDSYGDTIKAGAFANTLSNRGRLPVMLFGHNPGRVIGKWLQLAEDSRGLHGEGEFTPGHSDAQDVMASMRHGAIDGLSIGFRIPKGGAEQKEDGGRIIKQIDLVEISVVTFPADDAARITSVKEQLDSLESIRDVEAFLRESGGFSRAAAQALLSRVKSLVLSDSDRGGGEIDGVKAHVSRVLQLSRSLSDLAA